MKTYAVEVAAVAERHLRAILEWWKVNRPTLDDDRAVVTVRAVWHAARGRPPRLR